MDTIIITNHGKNLTFIHLYIMDNNTNIVFAAKRCRYNGIKAFYKLYVRCPILTYLAPTHFPSPKCFEAPRKEVNSFSK